MMAISSKFFFSVCFHRFLPRHISILSLSLKAFGCYKGCSVTLEIVVCSYNH